MYRQRQIQHVNIVSPCNVIALRGLVELPRPELWIFVFQRKKKENIIFFTKCSLSIKREIVLLKSEPGIDRHRMEWLSLVGELAAAVPAPAHRAAA